MNHFESKEWQTARLVHVGVDLENDFFPGGNLGVADGEQIIDPINRLTRLVRQANGVVVFTRDWHPATTNHFAKDGGVWPVHCVAGTFGAEFHRDIEIKDTDIVISKGTAVDEDAFSGFQGVDQNGRSLEQLITPSGEEHVIVLVDGLATDYCVEATVVDGLAIAKRYIDRVRILAVTDAMKAVNMQPGDGEKSLQRMQEAGAVLLTSNEVVTQLGRLGLVAA